MEDAENNFAIEATPKAFFDKPSQPSDSAEYSFYLDPKEDTNRPDASGPGVSEPQSLPAREPRQAERDDGPSSHTLVNVVVTAIATAENNPESGNRPSPDVEPHQIEVNVSGSAGDDPQSTTVSSAPVALNPGLSTQTGAREDDPPFPTEQENRREDTAGAVHLPASTHPIPSILKGAQIPSEHEDSPESTAVDTIPPERPLAGIMKCIKITVICLITGTLLSAIIIALFILGLALPNHRDLIPNTSLLQILPNDTVLLYNDTSAHDIVISEIVTPPPHKPNIKLYIVDCIKLIKHEENYTDRNRTTPLYDQNIAKPIPPFYPHYELGSTFNFSIKVLLATEQSSFSVLIFDNESQALDYTRNPTPQTGQEAVQNWSIATNETTTNSLYFKTLYGGYFVPVFSFETNGSLQIEYSYTIIRQFYLNTDYEDDEYKNCYLKYNESCSLNLEDKEKQTCILAYRQPSREDSIDLQTVTESSKVSIPHHKLILTITSYATFGVAVVGVIVIVLVCVCKKISLTKKKEHNPYHPLQQVDDLTPSCNNTIT